jgi:hypothetical protein
MIELACRSCGAPFVPTREDVRRGPGFDRHCPRCRAAVIGSPASKSAVLGRCRECGKPLPGTRDVCRVCLGMWL